MNVLSIENISKSYEKEVVVLDNISFSINKGEICGLVGENGAGKSTLINIICGFMPKDSGKINILGSNDIEKDYDTKKKIGFVSQENTLYVNLTVEENLKFHLKLFGFSKNEIKDKILEYSKLFDLDSILKKRIYKLSGGQKRKVSIAKAVIHEPSLLILDEPTTGLDPKIRKQLWEKLKILNKENQLSIVLVSHYLDEIDEICDSVCILYKSKMIIKSSIDELRKNISDNILEIQFSDKNELNKFLDIKEDIEDKIVKDETIKIGIDINKNEFYEICKVIFEENINIIKIVMKQAKFNDIYFYYVNKFSNNREKI